MGTRTPCFTHLDPEGGTQKSSTFNLMKRSPCIWFSPLTTPLTFVASGMNQESSSVTNLWETWLGGASPGWCPLAPGLPLFPYLCGVPLAALIGLALGGRGRRDNSSHQPICLQRRGAWKWYKGDESRKNSSRTLQECRHVILTPKPIWSIQLLGLYFVVSVDRTKRTFYLSRQM